MREYEDRDLAFFDALTADLVQRGCVDPKRIFATGFSNGGFFSNLLACRRHQRLAGAAPVSGGGPFEVCDGQVPIIIHHGTEDSVVSYEMAKRSFEFWQQKNACSSVEAPTAGCRAASDCTKPVELCAAPSGHRFDREARRRIAERFRGQGR